MPNNLGMKRIVILLLILSPTIVLAQNVGIGKTDPQAKLEIKQTTNLEPTLMLSDSSINYAGRLRFRSLFSQYANRGWYTDYKVGIYSKDNEIFLYNDSTNVMNIYGTGNITIGDAVNPDARLSILAGSPSADILNIMGNSYQPALKILGNRNVGIGVPVPAEKLDVNGNTRVSGYIRAQGISLHATTSFVPAPSAILDIESNNKGVLVPRMSLAERNAISNPEYGLLIFQINNNPGFYYNKAIGTPDWIKVGAENSSKGFVQFTTAGTSNFTVPQGVSSIEFEAISSGGGGGGGQIYNGTYFGIGGGGGGGGFFSGLLKVNPGDVLTIIVGAAGVGGTTNTTPNPGSAGTDASNTTITVNGNDAMILSGGRGGAGGFSDGSYNSGIGISGGSAGNAIFYFSITPYHTPYGEPGANGASWGPPLTPPQTQAWQIGLGGFILAYPQYSLSNQEDFHPYHGHGGRGGNNLMSGENGVLGYVKLKY